MCESSSGSESSQEASGAKGYGRILQRHKQELKLLAQTQKKVIGKAKGKEKKELAAKHSKETEEIQRKHQKELEPFAKPVDDSNDKPQSGGSVEGSDWTNFVSGGLSEETVLKQREAAKAKHEKRQRRKKGEEEELERKREEAAALGMWILCGKWVAGIPFGIAYLAATDVDILYRPVLESPRRSGCQQAALSTGTRDGNGHW
eukprot:GHVN01059243.1.p1 GENE.GHVN01059243.1~~GHVN01059243.1.p1  ORF type:complete len:203 (+),score=37.06 GHVN01059243.1:615-1223(+)